MFIYINTPFRFDLLQTHAELTNELREQIMGKNTINYK